MSLEAVAESGSDEVEEGKHAEDHHEHVVVDE